ncbi:hypothetical protein EfmAA94_09870 [Enterococcus faecium]|nr:hypothetical protein EfmAA94_09870 [Enterococcus faecium]
MSHTQLIKDTLNILDLNIYFEENCLTKEKYKGQICLIYKGTLLYKPEECSHCLCVVPSRIIRWGTTTVRLLLNDVSEYRTYLELKKQRFKCKSCQRTFVADTSAMSTKNSEADPKPKLFPKYPDILLVFVPVMSEKYFHFFGLSCHEAILPPIESFQTDFAKGLML